MGVGRGGLAHQCRFLTIRVFSSQGTRLEANCPALNVVMESKASGANAILALVCWDRFEFLDWVLTAAIVRVGSKSLKDQPKHPKERVVLGGQFLEFPIKTAGCCN